MKGTRSIALTLVALLLAAPSADLSAQIFDNLGSAVPGEDVVSVGFLFGQMNSSTKFRDGGAFDASTLMGGTVGFWAHKYIGFQVTAVRTEHVGLPDATGGTSVFSGRDPKIWTTMIDGMVRYPLMTDGPVSISPYAALGGGWKQYLFKFNPKGGLNSRGMDPAWSYAAGMDVRVGAQRRFGLRGEFRSMRTPMERWGEKLTYQDRVVTGGLLLNF